jgi:hypothetical protein
VTALVADTAVADALRTHRWVLVLDVASVGKTTLALRLAACPEYRGSFAFYLDLSKVYEDDDEQVSRALRRLSRTNALIILDNAHWRPGLTRELWEWWKGRPRRSRLLLLATHIQPNAGIAGDDALLLLQRDPNNPAVAVRPAPADLEPILGYVMRRIRGIRAAVPHPPDHVLDAWHDTYRSELGAFVAAITTKHDDLARGDWDLPVSAAADWMRNRHLIRLPPDEIDNLICLSVLAQQQLELDAYDAALPHPGQMGRLLQRGLVERRERGQQRHRSYRLREADWGALLLAAVDPLPDAEEVLLQVGCRHVFMALTLSSRLFRMRKRHILDRLWQRLGAGEARADRRPARGHALGILAVVLRPCNE